MQVRRQVQGRQQSRLEEAEEVGHLQAEVAAEAEEVGHLQAEVAAEAEEGGHLQAEVGEGGHHRQKEAEAELSLQQGEQKL